MNITDNIIYLGSYYIVISDTLGLAAKSPLSSEDITVITRQIYPNENLPQNDLMSSKLHQERYDNAFPDGYKLEWLGHFNNFEEFKSAILKAKI
ncbi:hypothetical protein M2146_001127 [Lachnospiraceae bacterium PF1-22]